MKKLRRILIFAAMVAVLTCLLCVALNAETYSGTCGENLTWTLDSDGLLKISGTGDMSGYYFSDDIPWVKYCQSIKTVEISAGVTSIGSDAFEYCTSLTSVTFGKNSQLASIGDSAFDYCTSLTSIEIPASVTNIGDYAIPSSATIHGEKGSAAEKYAKGNGFDFVEVKNASGNSATGAGDSTTKTDNSTAIIGNSTTKTADSTTKSGSSATESDSSTTMVVAAVAMAVVLIVLLTIVFIKKKKSA